jgi:hypothetical protein
VLLFLSHTVETGFYPKSHFVNQKYYFE